jgi:hypothetical protein
MTTFVSKQSVALYGQTFRLAFFQDKLLCRQIRPILFEIGNIENNLFPFPLTKLKFDQFYLKKDNLKKKSIFPGHA